jgi:hypothetical protein
MDARRVNDDDERMRAVRILVRSLHRSLVEQGYDERAILAVAIELIGRVNDSIADDKQRRRRA